MPLTLHFLNVGQGDCTIIEFPSGRVAVVDIDNLRAFDETTKSEIIASYRQSWEYMAATLLSPSTARENEAAFLRTKQDQLTDPLEYYNDHIGPTTPIFRMIVTHPDMDHMTGLYALDNDIWKRPINFWHSGPYDFNLANTSSMDWYRFDKRDWETYKKWRSSSDNPTALHLLRGASTHYYAEDQIELWAPTPELEALAVARGEPNILSKVLRIQHAGRSVVLGGDATAEETWAKIWQSTDLTGTTILKASHHGRRTGYHQPSIKEMSPWLTITSVGDPNYDASPLYRQYSQYTVSLRDAGDIRIVIHDDGIVEYPTALQKHWKPKT